jgi:hypothetical protein
MPGILQAMIARSAKQRINKPAGTNHADGDSLRAGCTAAWRIDSEVKDIEDTMRADSQRVDKYVKNQFQTGRRPLETDT